jgi:hypothetical protein
VKILLLILVLAFLMACSQTVPPKSEREAVATDLEALRTADYPAVYFLGESFEGLPLTSVDDECCSPAYVLFVYGSCTLSRFGEGGCNTPLQVQVVPISERYPALFSGPSSCELLTVRGVPAAFFGDMLDVYTGKVTVVIFGEPEQIQRVAEALRPLAQTGNLSEPLPSPEIDEDLLKCPQ